MHTEEEAKKKWCPFVRAELYDGAGVSACNRKGTNVDCIGSGCMAWRWFDDRRFQRESPGPEWRQYVEGGVIIDGIWERKAPIGYCGLAGK